MARKPTPPAVDTREATHQSIAADIAEFRRRGGRIQVLGNTPLRKYTPTSFRSNAAQRKPPTPPPKTRAAR
ncbi:hypothetical protein [Thermomonas sp.]|uniref:hypothetical protein n=1 Tax=Thermomonas sp. TaxID=1971895 RepID=UPI00391DDC2F